MINVNYILVDDDLIFRELTIQYLSLIPNLHQIAICDNAISARELILEHSPDMIILDVEMPGLTGLQLIKSLQKIPLTIFISSFPQFAADAFDVDAVDFIVKPFSPDRLFKAVDKLKFLLNMRNTQMNHENLQTSSEDCFFIRDKSAYVKIQFQEVLYIESMADFVTIYLTNGSKRIALVGLKTMEQQLSSQHFIRISRSHIVNIGKITAVENAMIYLDKLRVPIGKSYTDIVLNTVIGQSAIKRYL